MCGFPRYAGKSTHQLKIVRPLGMRMLESDIEKVAESLKIHLGVKYVKVSLAEKNIRIRIPFKERETEKAAPEDVLNRSTDLWSLYAGQSITSSSSPPHRAGRHPWQMN
jgi:hypothetical protein